MRTFPLVAAAALLLPVPASAEWVDKFALGVLGQDRSYFSDYNEAGITLNGEIVFEKPWADTPWLPAPVIGADINLNGDTSFVYAGLSWEVPLRSDVFVGGGIGLAAHNGAKFRSERECADDACGFGSRYSIRLAAEAGWWWDDRNAVSIYIDHISHAGWFGPQNEGVDNIGLRWHRKL